MEIKKVYTADMPAARFIGKKYKEADALNGSYAHKWQEAFESRLFGVIEAAEAPDAERITFDGGDAYIGFMDCTGEFAYWIGKFTAPGTPVPEGLEYVDLDAGRLGVGWVYGNDDKGELYGNEGKVVEALAGIGVKARLCGNRFFECYQCPRFTSPDEAGNVILDVCIYLD